MYSLFQSPAPSLAPPAGYNAESGDKVEEILRNREKDIMRQMIGSQAASIIFQNVDYMETGKVTWDDFTNYVVKGFQSTQFHNEETIRPYIPIRSINTSHCRDLSKIFQIEDIGEHGSLVVTEQGSRSFKIFTPNQLTDLHTLKPSMWTEVKGHGGDVLSVGHIPELAYLATSSTDCTIQFWDTNTYQMCQRLPVPAPILTTEWSPSYTSSSTAPLQSGLSNEVAGILFAGGLKNPRTGKVTITGYDPIKNFDVVAQMNMHTDTILDLYSIPTLHTLVSCGMDSRICLWDLQTSQFKKTLIGHTKGVLDIDYSAEHR